MDLTMCWSCVPSPTSTKSVHRRVTVILSSVITWKKEKCSSDHGRKFKKNLPHRSETLSDLSAWATWGWNSNSFRCSLPTGSMPKTNTLHLKKKKTISNPTGQKNLKMLKFEKCWILFSDIRQIFVMQFLFDCQLEQFCDKLDVKESR